MSFSVISCKKNKTPEPDSILEYNPIVLDCDYFQEDRTLVPNPNSTVDYLITCYMSVEGHIRIEPGVIIEFEEKAGIKVDGNSLNTVSFSAVGTEDKQIIFRGVENQKGYWTGIKFMNAPSDENELSYVVIQDAGYDSPTVAGTGGLACVGPEETNLKVSYTTLKNNNKYGLNIERASLNLNVFNNNTITENDAPVRTDAGNLGFLNTTNTFEGNINDRIEIVDAITSKIQRDLTWYKADVPYLLNNTLSIESDVNMQAGTEIIMGENAKINVGVPLGGSLAMNGTEDDEIIVRGEESTPGYWKHIRFENPEANNKMNHVRLINGALLAGRHSLLNINHVVFENCFDFGVSLEIHTTVEPEFNYSNLSYPGTPREIGDWDNLPVNP